MNKLLKWICKARRFCKTWRIPRTKFKHFEVQLEWHSSLSDEWFDLSLATRTDCDHAGAAFSLTFMKLFYIGLTFYDSRHKDSEYEPYFEDYQALQICGNESVPAGERWYYAIYYADTDEVEIRWWWNKFEKPEGRYYNDEWGKYYKVRHLCAGNLK